MKDINDMTPEERTQAWDDALANFKTATDTIQRIRTMCEDWIVTSKFEFAIVAASIILKELDGE